MKIRVLFHRWSITKYVMYTRIRCDTLSSCVSNIEGLFRDLGTPFVRLFEPDSYTLLSYTGRLYERKSVEVIEITDGTGRVLYLATPEIPVRPEDKLKPEFTLFFNVKSQEGLEALLRVIGDGRFGGTRHRYRSAMNFLVSFLGSAVFSALVDFKNYWLQSLLMLALMPLLYLVLDYPFSFLYLKGVQVLSYDPWKKRTFKFAKVMRIKKKS